MNTLQQNASKSSGLSRDEAFKIDNMFPFEYEFAGSKVTVNLNLFEFIATQAVVRHSEIETVDNALKLCVDECLPLFESVPNSIGLRDVIHVMQGVEKTKEVGLSLGRYVELGIDVFKKLSTEFYTRVYADEDAWFRNIFAGSKLEDAIQNQYEFFIQRMGGPPLFSERKGHPALIGRHKDFDVSEEAAKRWLEHMQDALDAMPSSDLNDDTKGTMNNFFKHTAWFLVHGQKMMKERAAAAAEEGK